MFKSYKNVINMWYILNICKTTYKHIGGWIRSFSYVQWKKCELCGQNNHYLQYFYVIKLGYTIIHIKIIPNNCIQTHNWLDNTMVTKTKFV